MKPVYAFDIGNAISWGNGTNLRSTFPNLGTLVNIILKNSITIIGIILVVLLIFGGVQFIIGAGEDDPKKVAQSKALITDAVIGFFITFLAFVIIKIIEYVTGLSILNSPL